MRRGHLFGLLGQHVKRGDFFLRRRQLFVQRAALGDIADDVFADAQPVGAVEFFLRLVLCGLRLVHRLLGFQQGFVLLLFRQTAVRQRHARQFGGDLQLRLRVHQVVLTLRQRVIGFHPDFLGALEPHVAVFAFQLHQLFLRGFVVAAQAFHLLVIAGDLRFKEHVARGDLAPLRHTHAFDRHALVGGKRQLHLLRLGESEVAAQLDFFLQLALLGGHQPDFGG